MKKVFIALLVIVLGLTIFIGYSGLFASIDIVEKEMGPYTIAYEDHIGDYARSGEIHVRVHNKLLNDLKVKTTRGVGIYYDNPEKVERSKCRSKIGSIIEKKDSDKIPELKDKINIMEIPREKRIVVEFPYKNMLSIFIGIVRVYPELNEYIKEKNYKTSHSIELYDMPGKKIYYMMNVAKD